MKNYRLAVDENGSPFVLNSKGSIDFGYITEEMNLSPAPIRVAEGNDSYGLAHMIKNHSEQLTECGFTDVASFVEHVTVNFTTIKEDRGLFKKLLADPFETVPAADEDEAADVFVEGED